MNTQALIATRKGLFQVTQDNQIEAVSFVGDPVSMILTHPKHSIWYAALDLGHFGVKLHRSDDKGKNWREMNVPEYPKAEDPTKGDSLSLIWSLEFADPEDPEKLWAGTIPGGLFYSEDGGQKWVLNQPLWQHKLQQEWAGGGFDQPGIHSICIDPRNHHSIRVGVSVGGVWSSGDNGDTWENCAKGMRAEYMPPDKAFDPNIQDPHRLVQCPAEPNNFWVQHHNGIFSSTDNSQSWQEHDGLKSSSFGFAVVVHPKSPETAWFVPGVKDECRLPIDAKFVVLRTRDGGQTFESLAQGLPQSASYDLVFRHALDIDSSGDRLLMGSTTGNLWFTDNQGDDWKCLSNYLPPVYAVRFL